MAIIGRVVQGKTTMSSLSSMPKSISRFSRIDYLGLYPWNEELSSHNLGMLETAARVHQRLSAATGLQGCHPGVRLEYLLIDGGLRHTATVI